MPELITSGYVYIAKPPLYRVKQGNQETYLERESELEELLLRVKILVRHSFKGTKQERNNHIFRFDDNEINFRGKRALHLFHS